MSARAGERTRGPGEGPGAAEARGRGGSAPDGSAAPATLDAVVAAMRACRVCREAPAGPPLPHEPVPVFQISGTARIGICSQAPGMRAHVAGLPFRDPSGVRLRAWLGVDEATFYDAARVAIVPMGFCFPGYDAKGGDLPPRRECRATWHVGSSRVDLQACKLEYSIVSPK